MREHKIGRLVACEQQGLGRPGGAHTHEPGARERKNGKGQEEYAECDQPLVSMHGIPY